MPRCGRCSGNIVSTFGDASLRRVGPVKADYEPVTFGRNQAHCWSNPLASQLKFRTDLQESVSTISSVGGSR
jgi:hypothetical protein